MTSLQALTTHVLDVDENGNAVTRGMKYSRGLTMFRSSPRHQEVKFFSQDSIEPYDVHP